MILKLKWKSFTTTNITYSNLLPNNKCNVSYIYSGDANGNDYRHFTFSNDGNCNWKVNLMDQPSPGHQWF